MAWVHPPAIGCRFSFLHLPCGRCGHTMSVYEDSLIVFGGYDGKKWLCDLHKFDINSLVWSQPHFAGLTPQPRQYHAAQIIDTKLYIYGGFNGLVWLKDLVIADLKEMKWKYPATYGSQPSAKEGLAMAAINKSLFIHGGWNGMPNGELHRFDTVTNEWILLRIEGFRPQLCGHSMTVVKETLFIFGGFDGVIWVNSLYTIEPFKQKKWTEPTVFGVPVARGYHSAVLFNKHILVYAGYNGKYILADIVALDIETLTWFLPDTCSGHFPTARNAHTMALHGSQLYLFGGYNGSRDTNELHILETSAFSSLHDDFYRAFHTNLWQDITISNTHASRTVHSVLLKSRVPLLYAQLLRNNLDFLDTRVGNVHIGSGNAKSLDLFCEYIYCDLTKEKISADVVEDLLRLAFKYNLHRLKSLCLKVIYESTENVPDSLLALDIMKCREEKELSDFTVYVKNTPFLVHRVVVAARCKYFRALMKSGMQDSQSNCVHFNDLDPKAFEIIVEWMYFDKFSPLFTDSSIDLEIGKELLSATSFLHLESLMRITEITLWKLINSANAFRMFEIACLFSTSQLKSYCLNYILRHFDKVSIQKELSFLSDDACDEISKYLPRRLTRVHTSLNNELVMVKYDNDEEKVVNTEPVMISGRLFQSLKITKKMTIQVKNSPSESLLMGLSPSVKSPIMLKLKPRVNLNIQGVKAGGLFNPEEITAKILQNYKRSHRSYKSHTLVVRGENKSQDKPEFFIKGFGSCKRGKSRMNSLVTFSNKNRDVFGSLNMHAYGSIDVLPKQMFLPGIKPNLHNF